MEEKQEKKEKLGMIVEVSWEVCNKVGGIHTVITTKAPYALNLAKNYLFIGPYKEEGTEFIERKVPQKYRKVIDEAEKKGIKIHYGKWQIRGEPEVMLIDFSGLWEKKNEIKKWYWDNYKIDSLFSPPDFDEPLIWSYGAGILLSCMSKKFSFIAHFHEWLSGGALLYLKAPKVDKTNIKTIFTTHATILGRTIASSGKDLYKLIKNINPDEEARRYNIQAKHLTEKASANVTDIFTTVSEITGYEAEHLLGRKPDLILPNGMDMSKFPTLEETTLMHVKSREAIRSFLSYYFFPYYVFNLKHNLVFFILGRYEYRNKGIDVTVKALAKLNDYLKSINSYRTITAFFFIPMANKGIRMDLLENKNKYNTISSFVEWNEKEILDNIKATIISGGNFNVNSIFTKDFLVEARKHLVGFKREGNPPISTHYVDESTPLMRDLYNSGLDNKPDDKVKVIVYPVYLSENDGLLGLAYYYVLAGGHLGIFPSYYEPWGYTPIESASMGTPAITTDMAGFGKYLLGKQKETNTVGRGIYVLEREGKNDEEVVNELFITLKRFSMLSHSERVHERLSAKTLSELFGWEHLIAYYKKAYELVLDKK